MGSKTQAYPTPWEEKDNLTRSSEPSHESKWQALSAASTTPTEALDTPGRCGDRLTSYGKVEMA